MVMRLALLALAGRRPRWSVPPQGMGSALGWLVSLVLWWPARPFAQAVRMELPASARRSVGRTVLGQLLEGSNCLD